MHALHLKPNHSLPPKQDAQTVHKPYTTSSKGVHGHPTLDIPVTSLKNPAFQAADLQSKPAIHAIITFWCTHHQEHESAQVHSQLVAIQEGLIVCNDVWVVDAGHEPDFVHGIFPLHLAHGPHVHLLSTCAQTSANGASTNYASRAPQNLRECESATSDVRGLDTMALWQGALMQRACFFGVWRGEDPRREDAAS